MSQRGKRPGGVDTCTTPVKRRKGRPPTVSIDHHNADDGPSTSAQGGASWQPRIMTDLKISRIYNRSAPEEPAELFR